MRGERTIRAAGGLALVLTAGFGIAYALGVISCGHADQSGAGSTTPGAGRQGGDDSATAGFVGTWIVSGITYSSCNGQPEASQDIKGDEWVASAGKSSDLGIRIKNACDVRFDVNGSIATAQPGQVCNASNDDAGSSSTQFTTLTMTLNANGAAIKLTGALDLTISGTALHCNVRGEYAATRKP